MGNLPIARDFSYESPNLRMSFPIVKLLAGLAQVEFLYHPSQDAKIIYQYPADIVILNVDDIGESVSREFIKRLRKFNETLIIAIATKYEKVYFDLSLVGANCGVSPRELNYVYWVIIKALNPDIETPFLLQYKEGKDRRFSRAA